MVEQVTPREFGVQRAAKLNALFDEKLSLAGGTMTGSLIVRTGASQGTANVAGDDIVVDGDGDSGVTVFSGNTNDGSYIYADDGSNVQCSMTYDHNVDLWRLLTGGSVTTQVQFDANGVVFNDGGLAALNARFEGDTIDHLFFLDSGNDSVHIGNSLLTGAGVGDAVMANAKKLRWINNAGTSSANQHIFTDTDDRLKMEDVDGSRLIAPALETKIATTSGTAHDFTGIPAGVRRIVIAFEGVSLSGTDHFLVQLGDSGGFETTGYVSTSIATTGAGGGSNTSNTTGFAIYSGAAANVLSGHMTLTRQDGSHLWVCSHSGKVGTTGAVIGGGDKTLSGELTQVRLTRTGSNTFDAGSVNIIYE